jgi:hypothetical protein
MVFAHGGTALSVAVRAAHAIAVPALRRKGTVMGTFQIGLLPGEGIGPQL